MKKTLFVVMFGTLSLIIMLLIGIAYGQSAQDAIKAVKKLDAKVESGMSYQKYREVLGDTNAEVKLFLESKNAKSDPGLTHSLKKIMENYQDAAELWQTIANAPQRVPYFKPDEQLSSTQWHINLVETSRRMFKKYPKAYDMLRVQRAGFDKEISLNEFLSIIWGEASKEVKKLSLD